MKRRWDSFLGSLSGWRRYALAYVLGFLAAFAFPPFNALPVLWLSFPALVWLLGRAEKGRQAFALGWCFAFGLLTLSLYWIAGALFVDIAKFWWVLPFAIAGLPAFFSFYYGCAAAAAWHWGLRRFSGVLFFAVTWFMADLARGHLFTGFPWDLTGYVWGDVLPVMQSVYAIGIEGLTLATLLLAVLPAALFLRARREALLWIAFGVVSFAGIGAWGYARLSSAQTTFVPNVRLRLVQPSTEQATKWSSAYREANFERLLALTFATPGDQPITHYIWPETATAFYLTEEPDVRREIARHMPVGTQLLTGVVRRHVDEKGEISYYNSLIAMDAKATINGGYDKHHLVPFGEYMPMKELWPFHLASIVGTGFTPGDGVHTMRAAGLPSFGPMICYEAIFSGEAADEEDRPSFLLNVTNDGWYKGTIGPAQHFAIASARAIEEGLPLVRVANNGITGVLDPYGRPVAEVGEKTPNYIDSDLPNSIKAGTFGEEQENKPIWLITFSLLLFLLPLRCRF